MSTQHIRLVVVLGALVWPLHAAAAGGGWPEFDDAHLQAGREVWLGTCRECHANSLSDAPQAKDRDAWRPRAAKGREALYRHALDGFEGPSGTEMPARGGNASLTDAEVKSAVDYMLKVAVP
ncbi:MAG: c-type cytochrome [Gammaproteobacteria bacterium]|jgi:cytochrome c5|nr:c-type cytochrome [Gammaproteobacteria bacterium]MBU0771934.1 c-type cytochrome [Gammaproteobacteria bacterium]MBU0855489.1 c-type cytochrome [Gammaproteobacteria bacterium]MBU1845695.1 c-type cytochrome [Gammaproteobacteria bacterium]